MHENTPIAELLGRHLALEPGAAAKHHALREHREAGAAALTVLLRKERTPVRALGRCAKGAALGDWPLAARSSGGLQGTLLGVARPQAAAGVLLICSPARCPRTWQANAGQYYEIDAARPLRQQLAGKVRGCLAPAWPPAAVGCGRLDGSGSL